MPVGKVKSSPVGSTKTIQCPGCDGAGKTEEKQNCPDCGGSGSVQAKVVKQNI